MARPIFPYEMGDPDFTWLITHYTENNPHCCVIEDSCLPVVFIKSELPPEEFVPDTIPVHEMTEADTDDHCSEDVAE